MKNPPRIADHDRVIVTIAGHAIGFAATSAFVVDDCYIDPHSDAVHEIVVLPPEPAEGQWGTYRGAWYPYLDGAWRRPDGSPLPDYDQGNVTPIYDPRKAAGL